MHGFFKTRIFTVHFFLICTCFCFVQSVLVLVLVSDSSREASFFLSFASTAGRLRSLLERCWLLRPLRLSTEVGLSSCTVCRSLINDSFLSQTSTVTPVSERDAALVRQFYIFSQSWFKASHQNNTSIDNVLLKNSPMPDPITSPIGLNLLIWKYRIPGVITSVLASLHFFLCF